MRFRAIMWERVNGQRQRHQRHERHQRGEPDGRHEWRQRQLYPERPDRGRLHHGQRQGRQGRHGRQPHQWCGRRRGGRQGRQRDHRHERQHLQQSRDQQYAGSGQRHRRRRRFGRHRPHGGRAGQWRQCQRDAERQYRSGRQEHEHDRAERPCHGRRRYALWQRHRDREWQCHPADQGQQRYPGSAGRYRRSGCSRKSRQPVVRHQDRQRDRQHCPGQCQQCLPDRRCRSVQQHRQHQWQHCPAGGRVQWPCLCPCPWSGDLRHQQQVQPGQADPGAGDQRIRALLQFDRQEQRIHRHRRQHLRVQQQCCPHAPVGERLRDRQSDDRDLHL